MKILCVLGEHNYGDPARGASYEYANFLPALRKLGHQVAFFESYNRKAYRDFAELNRKFLEKVQTEKPDLILCVLMHYELWLETLQLVREGTDAVLLNWSTDDSWKYEQFSKFVAPAFHTYATTYPEALAKFKRDGQHHAVLTQWAASSETLAEPLPAAQCLHGASFIGTAYGNRPQWIAALARHGIKVECFGHGWKNGAVSAQEIPGIISGSLISLNFADSGMVVNGVVPGRSRQIKARVFEVPGAGGFLLTESADGLNQVYKNGTEIAVFGGLAELVEKISYFTTHPEERDRVALAGHIRTRNEHTYEMRFGQLFNEAMRQRAGSTAKRNEIDFGMFNTIAKKHASSLPLQLLKFALLLPCLAIWGRARGPRAARRILFELSWRLVGKKTYSVSGWPGRLFYKES